MTSQQPREEQTNEYVSGYAISQFYRKKNNNNNNKNVDSLFIEMVIQGIDFFRTWMGNSCKIS